MKSFLTFATGVGTAALAWWAFVIALPEPADQVPATIEVRGNVLSLPALVAAHTGAPLYEGNQVDLLENGDDIFPAMLEAIESAEDSVNFLTFVYWTGDIAERMAIALADASRRGVEVRVLLDAVGASSMDSELVTRMEDAGATVAWFHPLSWHHFRQLNGRTHRKVLVVDGTVAFTGGVGIADEWSGDASNPDEWRDSHFRIRGPIVTHMQGAFAENWVSSTREVLGGDRFFPEQPAGGDMEATPLITSPRGDRSVIAFAYWMMMTRAERTIDIATPYFVPDDALVEALAATARRGIRVRLLLPSDHNDSNVVRWTSRALYGRLLDAGVEIHEFAPSMMHTKLLLMDDEVAIVGSANFDNRSFELNDEVGLVVEDATFGAQLAAGFQRDVERAARMDKGSVVEVKWWQRAAGHVGLLLREQL